MIFKLKSQACNCFFYFIVCKNAFTFVLFLNWIQIESTVYLYDIYVHSPKETIMAKLSWLFYQSEFKINYLILIFVYYDPSLGDCLIKIAGIKGWMPFSYLLKLNLLENTINSENVRFPLCCLFSAHLNMNWNNTDGWSWQRHGSIIGHIPMTLKKSSLDYKSCVLPSNCSLCPFFSRWILDRSKPGLLSGLLQGLLQLHSRRRELHLPR